MGFLVRSPVSAIHARVQLHIGDVAFFLYGDHFLTFGATFILLARLFFAGATFFFAGETFFSGATFFFRRDFFSLALLCRPLQDLLWAQSTKKCG